MKKGNRVLNIIRGDIRMFHFNKNSTRRFRYLILLLVCVLVFGGATHSFAGWKDRDCVLIVGVTATERSNLAQKPAYRFSSWDEDAFVLSGSMTISDTDYWMPSLEFYYWDPTYPPSAPGRWRYQIIGLSCTNCTLTPELYHVMLSYKRLPSGANPTQLYPNGCSDLPSQQPDQALNPDTGKPECSNQIPMN